MEDTKDRRGVWQKESACTALSSGWVAGTYLNLSHPGVGLPCGHSDSRQLNRLDGSMQPNIGHGSWHRFYVLNLLRDRLLILVAQFACFEDEE